MILCRHTSKKHVGCQGKLKIQSSKYIMAFSQYLVSASSTLSEVGYCRVCSGRGGRTHQLRVMQLLGLSAAENAVIKNNRNAQPHPRPLRLPCKNVVIRSRPLSFLHIPKMSCGEACRINCLGILTTMFIVDISWNGNIES
jgi:hypothetical protein